MLIMLVVLLVMIVLFHAPLAVPLNFEDSAGVASARVYYLLLPVLC